MALMLLINWFKLLKVYNKKMLMFLFLLEDGILAVIMTYMQIAMAIICVALILLQGLTSMIIFLMLDLRFLPWKKDQTKAI